MKTIERKMIAVQERVQRLRQLAEGLSSFDDYNRSADARDIAERNLQIAIEACLDIGKIIISKKRLPEPQDYKGIFMALAQAHIIRPDLPLVSHAGGMNGGRGYDVAPVATQIKLRQFSNRIRNHAARMLEDSMSPFACSTDQRLRQTTPALNFCLAFWPVDVQDYDSTYGPCDKSDVRGRPS